MIRIAFDFRYSAAGYSRQKPAAHATVGTVGFFPALNRVAVIFVHDEIFRSASAITPSFIVPRVRGRKEVGGLRANR
jgi:hypothetical protein